MNTTEKLSYRRSPQHNYSEPGTYHLLLETEGREDVLGRMYRGVMTLNVFGELLLSVLAFALHRFPCVSIRAMDVRPDCVEMVLDISGWRQKLRAMVDDMMQRIHDRRTMTIPLFVGYSKMNSARAINSLRGVCNVPIWTERYQARVLTDQEEISRLCAELDLRYARVRFPKKPAPYMEASVTLMSALTSYLVGMFGVGAAMSASIESPEQTSGAMLSGRALFITGPMVRSQAEVGDGQTNTGGTNGLGAGGLAAGPRMWSIGP